MNILKSVVSIQTIMFVRLLGGLYYKTSSNKVVNNLVRIYCVSIATAIITINVKFFAEVPVLAKIQHIIKDTLYIANVIINLHYQGEKFLNFLTEIGATHSTKLDDKIPISRLIFIFSTFGKASTYIIFALTSTDKSLELMALGTFSSTLAMILYSSNCSRTMMFELLWYRTATLREKVEQEFSTHRRFEEGEEVTRKNIISCINYYKNLLSMTRETDAPMKPLIFISVVTLIPKILNTTYAYIVFGSIFKNNAFVLEAFIEFTITLSPALIIEMINSEIDKIKLCVLKKLLVCKDEATRDAIEDAMMFFRQNTFKYTIWRLFSVDMNMVLSLISLLTTYTVAMVQFAHFYD